MTTLTTDSQGQRNLTADDVHRAAGVVAAMAVIPGLQDGLACFDDRLECVGWAPGVECADGAVLVPVPSTAASHDERRGLVLNAIRETCAQMGACCDDPLGVVA